MLNSVLIEGVVLDTPECIKGNVVGFKVHHKEELIINVTAEGALGSECTRLLKIGWKYVYWESSAQSVCSLAT